MLAQQRIQFLVDLPQLDLDHIQATFVCVDPLLIFFDLGFDYLNPMNRRSLETSIDPSADRHENPEDDPEHFYGGGEM